MTKAQRNTITSEKYLSENQLSRLLRYVENKAEQARQMGSVRAIVNELIILLLTETGLRAHELCSLNISDLSTDHGTSVIQVRNNEGDITRIIEIPEKLTERLEEFVKLYRKYPGIGGPLFVSERGGRLAYMSLYSKVKKIGEKASIGKLNPHMLRHTHLMRLYRVKKNLRLVQERAGHVNLSTTKIYYTGTRTRIHRQSRRRTTASTISSSKRSTQISMCKVCDRPIPEKIGTKIDSGQILCSDCLKEFYYKISKM